jgi:hypothetical protein
MSGMPLQRLEPVGHKLRGALDLSRKGDVRYVFHQSQRTGQGAVLEITRKII